MYDLVYSRKKNLKDDSRLFYYSFAEVMRYSEVIVLIFFVIIYMTSSGINLFLTHVHS